VSRIESSSAVKVRRRLPGAALAAALLGAALACWMVAAQRMNGMDMGPGTDLGSFSFFLGVWTTMMAAMMLPSALPMVLLFDKVARGRRAAGRPTPSTLVFVSSYLVVWAGMGIVAFGLYRGLRDASLGFLAWDRDGPWVTGGAIVAAGLYELTPLKQVCLRHCRSPLHFVLGGWKSGTRGALLMGAEHGTFCVGCCWGLMVILFALGVMSLTWMLVVAALVFAQKVLPFGGRLQVPLALVLVGLGLWVALSPGTVPGLTVPTSSSM
jgi:predicted metal-binding membrane protein